MVAVLKIIQVFLLASVKYVVTFPIALLIGLNFLQTLIAVTLGGIAGFFFFYYLSGYAIKRLHHLRIFLRKHLPLSFRLKFRQFMNWRKQVTGERVFSKRNRFIAWFRSKFGLLGIVVLSPIILSQVSGSLIYFAAKACLTTALGEIWSKTMPSYSILSFSTFQASSKVYSNR